ncbi:MAG: VOC family protein [Candidatus Binataceae bacterium]
MSAESRKTDRARGKIAPTKFAHAVLRTKQLEKMIDWYSTVLEMRVQYRMEMIAFLTYDDEHHRLALVAYPGLVDRAPHSVGLDHLAYTYADMGELVATYERLKAAGIVPARTINHGPTTSMYYQDPDGNRVELQIDNFDTMDEAAAYFRTGEFSENPIGVTFDADELARKFHAGVPVAELKRRPSAPLDDPRFAQPPNKGASE